MPSVKDGQTRGFKLYGVRPGSLFKLLDIKNGDLITAVNGRPLDTIDSATRAFTELRRADQLVISYERKGVPSTVTLTLE